MRCLFSRRRSASRRPVKVENFLKATRYVADYVAQVLGQAPLDDCFRSASRINSEVQERSSTG